MSLVKKRHFHKMSNFRTSSYDFSDGHPMTDDELVKWMHEMYDYMLSDSSIDYCSRACGSSLIIAHKVVEDEKKPLEFDIEFYIVDGYKNLTLFNKEIGEDFIWAEYPDAENKPSIFFHKEEEAL